MRSGGKGRSRGEGGELNRSDRALVEVAAALAAGEERVLREALLRARERAAAKEVEEVLLQSYLFLGYPAALNALALWRSLSRDPPSEPEEIPGEEWRSRGEEVCRRVYGDQYGALRRNVRALHPEMEEWMLTEGYGKVLGRPGLELRVRELTIAAILAVRALPVQLYSHLRGALNVGASSAEVEAALDAAGAYAGEEGRRAARETWARLRHRGRG